MERIIQKKKVVQLIKQQQCEMLRSSACTVQAHNCGEHKDRGEASQSIFLCSALFHLVMGSGAIEDSAAAWTGRAWRARSTTQADQDGIKLSFHSVHPLPHLLDCHRLAACFHGIF
mmetsp:Transcript_30005/g.77417  ORF Transcript_30005/g.77417 Transcript_30005/m.77417 type:complete len:116 (+) Transcript_30005:129-476(+)